MMTCSMPAATASSTAYWMTGRSTSGQHLLRLGLGGGQEAGAPAGGGEDGLANAHRTSDLGRIRAGRLTRGRMRRSIAVGSRSRSRRSAGATPGETRVGRPGHRGRDASRSGTTQIAPDRRQAAPRRPRGARRPRRRAGGGPRRRAPGLRPRPGAGPSASPSRTAARSAPKTGSRRATIEVRVGPIERRPSRKSSAGTAGRRPRRPTAARATRPGRGRAASPPRRSPSPATSRRNAAGVDAQDRRTSPRRRDGPEPARAPAGRRPPAWPRPGAPARTRGR